MDDRTDHSVSIEMDALPVLSYAMAHNRIPVVGRLTLSSAVDLQDVVVRTSVSDSEGVLTLPCERTADLAAGTVTVLDDVALRADAAAMLQVDEQRPGSVLVEVLHVGAVVGVHRRPIQLLAAQQWLRQPPVLSLELLAAFVMPNDPAVGELVDEATTLLLARTGSPSLQGYQSGTERVDQIAEALFDAMRARDIRYSEPPASWADVGQKIRTPTDVLSGRMGTCLDTAVVLAAALEQSGVRPLLWLVDGHAFLGYWREETALDAIVETEVQGIVNLVDLGFMRLIETTLVTASSTVTSFDRTEQLAAQHLTGDLHRVKGVVDVWAARRNGIVPLPARRRTTEGVNVVEYLAAEHSAPSAARPANAVREVASSRTVVPLRVQQWKNSLLDLSLRNRLINYTDRAGLVLHVPRGHLATLEDQLHDGQSIQLVASDSIDQVQAARGVSRGADLPQEQLVQQLLTKKQVFVDLRSGVYQTRMRSLAYKARTITEETGANNLYLALGSLVWQLDSRSLRSPLVLVPVKLTTRAKTGAYRLELDESGSSTPNFCLLEKLHQLHGMRVPGLAEPASDSSGIDLDAALDAMRLAVLEKQLPYRVEATADLTILQFAKFRLWKDLDENWEAMAANDLVKHLIHTPTEPFEQSGEDLPTADLDELDALCPVPGDASQLRAVADAVRGRTFVLEGPPGTGKSQTITNLLTRAVAEGQRVLFVAEKRAALDVVRSRLDAVGMAAFCLDLHDKGSKPSVVRAQIKLALDHEVGVDVQGLAAQNDDLRAARRTLARYAERLHEPNVAGLSFYSARTGALALGGGPALPVDQALLAREDVAEQLAAVRNALRTLPDTATGARPRADHPWGFVALDQSKDLDVATVRSAASAVDTSLDLLPTTGPVVDALVAARTPDDLSALVSLLQAPGVPLRVLDATRTRDWRDGTAQLGHELQAFVAAAHPGLDVVTPAAMDLPLADIYAQAQAAAASSWFGRKKRLRTVLERLEPCLTPGSVVKPRAVPELMQTLLQLQGTVRALADRASATTGLPVPTHWNPLTTEGQRLVQSQVTWLSIAGRAVDAAAETSRTGFATALRTFLERHDQADPESAALIASHADAVRALLGETGTTPGALDRWCGDHGLLGRWASTRAGRQLEDPGLTALRRWVSFLESLKPLERAGLTSARASLLIGDVEADDALRAFERGLTQTCLTERRDSTGLDAFDALSHGRTIARFSTAAASVRAQMSTAVPAQVLHSRPFEASNGRGRVGALQRELAKQRGGLGVRALLSQYCDLITQVMPCVLVSPDSLARFFPVGKETFDLVVFDEASQIRVADAIGAMGRGRSVVVVGDSKQMPPTSFAEIASDDEEASEDVVLTADEESILTECVQARVPRQWLSWHYRSQDESLIAFSNKHYYDGRLSSFPAPTTGRASSAVDGVGISLVPVAGTFNRAGKGKLLRTNVAEAEAVVAEIKRRFDLSPGATPSIGVITFNQQQRALIEALLRDTTDERFVEALDGREEEGLFVKNLENVQGDERDVILFSTAFSANDKGVVPLNFGPLNRGGGERRLNVAVTRARRQVIVFTSFAPAQLRAEETSSLGIKHLRAYLDLAAGETQGLESAARSTSAADRHRQHVAEMLRERGLVVREELGLSDFKIDLGLAMPQEPDRLLVAVLLDGEGWRRRGTVGDRDGLPVQVLSTMLRWPAVERVWLPEWMSSSVKVVDGLEMAAKIAAQAAAGPSPLEPVITDAPEPTPFAGLWDTHEQDRPVPFKKAPPAVATSRIATPALRLEEPFVAWTPRITGTKEVLDRLPGSARAVRSVIVEVVEVQGPIHVEELAKVVASSFGLSRVPAARTRAIIEQIPASLIPDPSEPFAWPGKRVPSVWKGFRRSHVDSPRAPKDVSVHELVNTMVAIADEAFGIEREELLRETNAVLGGRRLTPSIQAPLDAALTHALNSRRLTSTGGFIKPGTAQ